MTKSKIQVLVPSKDLVEDMAYFQGIGFRLDNIFPDDSPAVAVMSGHDIQIRLDKEAQCPPPILCLLTDDQAQVFQNQNELLAPNGTRIKILPKTYQVPQPATQHTFEVRQLQDKDPWIIGRAGMLYRDLIPNRLGGSIMASHIRIPEGGPVPDMVHYHTIGFQLIFCYKGWVRLVYEDQGEPFILGAGDCVTQPPEIRHRVLESSDNLEVIEIGVPAEHMTTIDHDLELPTKEYRPNRVFQGQRFCHHKSKEAKWQNWRINGFECRDTGINEATNGIASVQVARPVKPFSSQQLISHDADILFAFVMEGNLELEVEGHKSHLIKKGEAFVIPPNLNYKIPVVSEDLEVLEVSLPGNFNTKIH